jgi:O-antigen/teichoic acid export membrane protein
MGYFYFEKNSESDRRAVVGTTVLGALILGCLAGLICWPLQGTLARLVFRTPEALLYLPIVFITMAPEFLFSALLSWLRVEERPRVFAFGSLLRVGVTLVGIITLVGLLKMRVMGYLYTATAGVVLADVVLGGYCFHYVRPTLDFGLLWRMVRFAAPIGLTGLAMFVINFGDQFILLHFGSLANVGLYSLAYRIGMLVATAYSAFQTYWGAQVFQILRRDDADVVFARFLTYVVFGLSSCSLVLVICSRPGLRLLAAPSFQSAAPIIPVVVAAYWLRGITDFLRCLFLAAGRPGYDALCNWLAAGICVAAYFLLIPRYGIWGAAIATVLSCLAVLLIVGAWTYRLKRYHVEAGRLTKLASAMAGVLLLHSVVPVVGLPLQIAWAACLLAIFPCALWLLRFPTAGEVDTLRSALQAITDRRHRLPGV